MGISARKVEGTCLLTVTPADDADVVTKAATKASPMVGHFFLRRGGKTVLPHITPTLSSGAC